MLIDIANVVIATVNIGENLYIPWLISNLFSAQRTYREYRFQVLIAYLITRELAALVTSLAANILCPRDYFIADIVCHRDIRSAI